jgi:hypothetical protein
MRGFQIGAVGDSSVLQHVAVYTSIGLQVTTLQRSLMSLSSGQTIWTDRTISKTMTLFRINVFVTIVRHG